MIEHSRIAAIVAAHEAATQTYMKTKLDDLLDEFTAAYSIELATLYDAADALTPLELGNVLCGIVTQWDDLDGDESTLATRYGIADGTPMAKWLEFLGDIYFGD